MSKLFSQRHYEQLLRGYTIYDCAMNNKDRYCFLLVERKENRDTLPRTRFVIVLADRPMEERFGWFETGELSFCTIARGTTPAEYVAVDIGSQVYSSNAQRKGVEKSIDQVLDMRTAMGKTGIVHRVVRVAGQIYALGDYRKIYRRIGMDQWVELGKEGKGAPMPADAAKRENADDGVGFVDMCGFNELDMYAVGGKGDVWHFNGQKWKQCPFPTNTVLETVACGGDGQVYISDQKGCVWAGRENRWTQVAEADFNWGSQPTDSAWFKGRLYLGSQECLYVLGENKKLVLLRSIDRNSPNGGDCGRVDVSPDGQFMLTAGSQGASLFDGQKWTKLFSSFDFM